MRRTRFVCTPRGSNRLLQLLEPPPWHHLHKSHELLAELAINSRRSMSWVAKVRQTEIFVEIVTGPNGYSQRSLPQRKLAAALRAMHAAALLAAALGPMHVDAPPSDG